MRVGKLTSFMMLAGIAFSTALGQAGDGQKQPAVGQIAEPEYTDQYVAVVRGQLVPLERQKAMTDTQNRRNFVITPSMRVFQSIPGSTSPVRVGPTTHFLVRMETGGRDPLTLIHLEPLKVTKKDREITKMTYKESLIPFGGVKHDRAVDSSIALTVRKVGAGSLEIVPQAPLPAGEYAFVTGGFDAQCFGVDAGLAAEGGTGTDSGANAAAPAARAPAESAPPPSTEWTVKTVPEISSAGADVMQTTVQIRGRTTIRAQQANALLNMHCGIPANEFPGLLPLEVLLGGTDEMLQAPGMVGAWLDISSFAVSQLGDAPALDTPAVSQNRTTGARVRFFYDWQDMQQIVNSHGQKLSFMVRSGQAPAPEISAVFTLPADSAPLRQMMRTCLDQKVAESAAVAAKTVASCPVPKQGDILDSLELKYADTGKAVKGESDEEDFGETWNLGPAVKSRPVRKVTMVCS